MDLNKVLNFVNANKPETVLFNPFLFRDKVCLTFNRKESLHANEITVDFSFDNLGALKGTATVFEKSRDASELAEFSSMLQAALQLIRQVETEFNS